MLSGSEAEEAKAGGCKIRNQSATPSACEMSSLMGKFNSVTKAVSLTPLFSKAMQRDLAIVLEKSNQSYNAPCQLSPASKEELDWWTNQLTRWNVKSLVMTQPDSQMHPSQVGEHIARGGPWSSRDKRLNINCLELLAATLAVKTFLKNQVNKHVLPLLDNQTAVAYINNNLHPGNDIRQRAMDVVPRTSDSSDGTALARKGHNVRADTESRQMKDCSDWMLNPTIFQQAMETFLYLEVDLFANTIDHPTSTLLQ